MEGIEVQSKKASYLCEEKDVLAINCTSKYNETPWLTEWVICDKTLWFSTSTFCKTLNKPKQFSANLMSISRNDEGEPLLRIRARPTIEHSVCTYILASEIVYLRTMAMNISAEKAECMRLAEMLHERFLKSGHLTTDTPTIGLRGTIKKENTIKVGQKPAHKIRTLSEVTEKMETHFAFLHNKLENIEESLVALINQKQSPDDVGEHVAELKEKLRRMGFEIQINPIKE